MSNASMLERLSCNIFITNFPAYFSSKDLWNTCSKFGIVLDVYIPNKVSNQGKRYAFAHFKKVSNVDSLISSLSLSPWTPHFEVQDRIVWIDVEEFGEENSDESEDYSDNSSVGKKNWVESEEGEIIPESVQNDAFIDNIAESEPINGDSRENQSGQ
uniref:Glucose-methanol-choline oxidoreductase, FAD/NAD(P)-binding domain protein n=1 Tax=Tanacetum cinerariifolium TaxID=118510 RepID=A0A699JV70_TANCI|nr:glucose-methanol-choline oxidoreductase, FAD/NAD(P)-binding domain protein [Tanacetum cinerariifolium]